MGPRPLGGGGASDVYISFCVSFFKMVHLGNLWFELFEAWNRFSRIIFYGKRPLVKSVAKRNVLKILYII